MIRAVIGFCTAVATTSCLAQAPMCSKDLQPFGERCVTQRMADYISCVESSGANRSEIIEEVSSLKGTKAGGSASAAAGNKIVRGSGSLALDKRDESALVSKLEKRWFPGSMSECSKVLNSTKKANSGVELSRLLVDREREGRRLIFKFKEDASPDQQERLGAFEERYRERMKAARGALAAGDLVRLHELNKALLQEVQEFEHFTPLQKARFTSAACSPA